MPQPLRVIAYNVLDASGYNGDANAWPRWPWVPGRMAEELAKYVADVITFSEAPREAVVREIASGLGMQALFIRSGQKWPGVIFTRFPVASFSDRPSDYAADLFTRHWGRAELVMPGGKRLVVHSLHLFPSEDAGRPVRLREMDALRPVLQADLASGDSVLALGDLNHEHDRPEYPLWSAMGLIDAFAAAGSGEQWTFTSRRPHRRLDYIWAAGPLAGSVRRCRVLHEKPFGFDEEGAMALSDHLPVLAEFALS